MMRFSTMTPLLAALGMGVVVYAAADASAQEVQPPAPLYSWLLDTETGGITPAQFGGQDGTMENGAALSTEIHFGYTGNMSMNYDGTDDNVALGSEVVGPHSGGTCAPPPRSPGALCTRCPIP